MVSPAGVVTGVKVVPPSLDSSTCPPVPPVVDESVAPMAPPVPDIDIEV